ncbi:MAG TPA: polysaccharide deacetylase family protein, partial [Candidatus Nitrosotalea sp.]|nr:polysaccharide deacetylase family protein [Candidatus Nitrosotalea sp.]
MKLLFAILFVIFFGVIHEASAVQSCQCVVFRMDDVQDYWLDDVQVGIIHEFEQKNASLTAGIIGNYFGQDEKVVGAVSDALKQDEPKFVVANHGWNHENFAAFSRDEQSALIHNTNQKISDTLGITPNIFIAPYNSINNDTLISLLDNNMIYLSTNETQDTPPYALSDAAFFRFPATADIGDLNPENTVWVDLNHDQTYATILRSIVKYGFAVVLLHPQDYANKHVGPVYDNTINQTQIHELDLLIDKIRSDGYSMVTMDDIPKNAVYDTTYPKWLDTVFSLYFKEKISDREMTNSIEYLKSNEMITSSLTGGKYPWHTNITTTYFWIGEPADADNQYISNTASAWDDR